LKFLSGQITHFRSFGLEGQLTLADAGRSDATTTILEFVKILQAALPPGKKVEALVLEGTSSVILTQYGGTVENIMDTLWHEFWHAGLGWEDGEIVNKFKINVGAGQTSSEAFEKWLKDDCQNLP
jgi:hypothetical protein